MSCKSFRNVILKRKVIKKMLDNSSCKFGFFIKNDINKNVINDIFIPPENEADEDPYYFGLLRYYLECITKRQKKSICGIWDNREALHKGAMRIDLEKIKKLIYNFSVPTCDGKYNYAYYLVAGTNGGAFVIYAKTEIGKVNDYGKIIIEKLRSD